MFNSGYMAGGQIVDGIREGVDNVLAIRKMKADAAERQQSADLLKQWQDAHRVAAITNAANYAEKQALRAALERLDPNHPLIVNKALQEKIQDAGERIAVMSNFDYDAILKAGRDYKY